MSVYKLEGAYRSYPWGSRTLIAGLRGEPVPSTRPEAELWFGAHPGAPSHVDGTPLDQIIAQNPQQTLGTSLADDHPAALPFLVKLLAADQPLSLQAHPSKQQAEDGYDREDAAGIPVDAPQRNYKDRNHKPEVIIALTEFTAMVGFRPLDKTMELFTALDCPLASRYVAMVDATGDEEAGLRALFTTWISLPRSAREELISAIMESASALGQRGDWIGDVLNNAAALNERYPGDVGVLGSLLLNLVTLQPGEALFLDAGNLHAYVSGLGVEVMANSDNVLRGGLTSKYVDVGELVRVLKFQSLSDPRVPEGPDGYQVPVDDFTVRRLTIEPGHDCTAAVTGPVIALCTRGRAQVGDVTVPQGNAVWIPAESDAVTLSAENAPAEIFWVTC